MPMSRESLIRRFESTAETYKKKGDRNWAYAKNDLGDEHYGIAKEAYKRSDRARKKADALRKGE
jgi:hypothetical protein